MRGRSLLVGALSLLCGCDSVIRVRGDVHELVGSQSELVSTVWIDEAPDALQSGSVRRLGGALIRLCHGADFGRGAVARGRCEQFYANELGQFEETFRTRSRIGDQCIIVIEYDGMMRSTGAFLYEGRDRHVHAVLVPETPADGE
jgi:hypothetical protein